MFNFYKGMIVENLRRLILCFSFIFIFYALSFAQYSKGVDDILELHKTNPEKALIKMAKFVKKGGTNRDWDLYVNMYHFRYRVAKDSLHNNELAERYFAEFIELCKQATLQAYSLDAARYIEKYLMRPELDADINALAQNKLKVAEDFFLQKKYLLAADLYAEAIDLDAKYYRARLYLGMCYLNLRRYEGAKFQFEELARMFPTELEPRQYLIDSYMETHEYREAYNRSLNLVYLCPNAVVFSKITQAMAQEKRGFNLFWFPRPYEVNIPGKNQDGEYPEQWTVYRQAKKDIEPYCNEYGIVTEANKLTSAKYMEEYAWEQMIKHPKAIGTMFDFARKMKQRNMLDCFVFISLYHYDLHFQYKEFIKTNQKKVKTYIESILIR